MSLSQYAGMEKLKPYNISPNSQRKKWVRQKEKQLGQKKKWLGDMGLKRAKKGYFVHNLKCNQFWIFYRKESILISYL